MSISFRLLSGQTPRKLILSTFSIGISFMTSLGTKEHVSVCFGWNITNLVLVRLKIICLLLTSHRFFSNSLFTKSSTFETPTRSVYSIVVNKFITSANRINSKRLLEFDMSFINKWSQNGTPWYTSNEMSYWWFRVISFDIQGAVG